MVRTDQDYIREQCWKEIRDVAEAELTLMDLHPATVDLADRLVPLLETNLRYLKNNVAESNKGVQL